MLYQLSYTRITENLIYTGFCRLSSPVPHFFAESTKYTGSGGKYGTSDASAEFLGYVRAFLDAGKVVWQTGNLGKVDGGGGGTIAKYIAERDVDTVDVGVPILSMHAPFELSSVNDVYMTYRAFAEFDRK